MFIAFESETNEKDGSEKNWESNIYWVSLKYSFIQDYWQAQELTSSDGSWVNSI